MDDLVVASGRDGPVVIYPFSSARLGSSLPPDRAIDVVVDPHGSPAAVAVAADHGARVVGAVTLHEMLRYAVDRSVATGLCERHLGGPPGDLRPPLRRRIRERVQAIESPVRPTSFLLAVVVLVTLGTIAGLALTDPPTELTDTTDGVTGRSNSATERSDGSVGATPPIVIDEPSSDDALTPTADPALADASLPPGVTPDGIENLTAVAVAHDRALDDRSYTLWLDTYRPHSWDPSADRIHHDIDLAVEGDRYLVETTIVERNARTPTRSVYYDGTDWYVSESADDNTSYRRVQSTTRPATVSPDPVVLRRTLITQYLSTPETAVTGRVEQDQWAGGDGHVLYRIVGRGTPSSFPFTGIRNYSVVAHVDTRGLVRNASGAYTVASGTQRYRVRFEWTYGLTNETTVDPPEWYERAFPIDATDSTIEIVDEDG